MKISVDSKWIMVVFCSLVCSRLIRNSECFSIENRDLNWDDIITKMVNQTRVSRDGEEITLIGFLQESVKKYGEKKVASSIHELAQKSMYDLMWMLAGDLEPWLILDLYKAYSYSTSDPAVLSVYERFKAGNVNRTIVPEVFALDKKYNEFEWWKRVRTRMLDSVDKYMAGTLKVNGAPPTINFGSNGNPTISVNKPAAAAGVASQPATEDPDDPDEEDGEDSEFGDLLDALGK